MFVTPRARVFRSRVDDFSCQFSVSWSLINKHANWPPRTKPAFMDLLSFLSVKHIPKACFIVCIISTSFVKSPQANYKLREGRRQLCWVHSLQCLTFCGSPVNSKTLVSAGGSPYGGSSMRLPQAGKAALPDPSLLVYFRVRLLDSPNLPTLGGAPKI